MPRVFYTVRLGDGGLVDAGGAYDFGLGAGVYVNVTAVHFFWNCRMQNYIENELAGIIAYDFSANLAHQGIMGHFIAEHITWHASG